VSGVGHVWLKNDYTEQMCFERIGIKGALYLRLHRQSYRSPQRLGAKTVPVAKALCSKYSLGEGGPGFRRLSHRRNRLAALLALIQMTGVNPGWKIEQLSYPC
jgi:hypothetical protein